MAHTTRKTFACGAVTAAAVIDISAAIYFVLGPFSLLMSLVMAWLVAALTPGIVRSIFGLHPKEQGDRSEYRKVRLSLRTVLLPPLIICVVGLGVFALASSVYRPAAGPAVFIVLGVGLLLKEYYLAKRTLSVGGGETVRDPELARVVSRTVRLDLVDGACVLCIAVGLAAGAFFGGTTAALIGMACMAVVSGVSVTADICIGAPAYD